MHILHLFFWFSLHHLELFQGRDDKRLAGCLLSAEGQKFFHGLMEGFALCHQVGRLHHNQQQIVHLGIIYDISEAVTNG